MTTPVGGGGIEGMMNMNKANSFGGGVYKATFVLQDATGLINIV